MKYTKAPEEPYPGGWRIGLPPLPPGAATLTEPPLSLFFAHDCSCRTTRRFLTSTLATPALQLADESSPTPRDYNWFVQITGMSALGIARSGRWEITLGSQPTVQPNGTHSEIVQNNRAPPSNPGPTLVALRIDVNRPEN